MNSFFKALQRVTLRQILVIFLIIFTFFGFQAFGHSNATLVAQADTVKTPEGVYYKGTPDAAEMRNDQTRLKETADNVRERLNLDEPIPESTREFLDDVQTNVQKSVEPITGTRHGYYQENIPQERISRDKM